MKKTSNICKIMAAVITASCLTACNATTSKTIPAVNEATISEAANTLGVSTEDLEMYFENLDTTFDDYIETLNNNNTTLETLKENIEKNYDCTFKNYIDTVITVNNKTIPDDSFSVFKSKYSVHIFRQLKSKTILSSITMLALSSQTKLTTPWYSTSCRHTAAIFAGISTI